MQRIAFYIILLSVILIGCDPKGKQNEEVIDETPQEEVAPTPQLRILTDKLTQEPNNAELYYARSQAYHKIHLTQNALTDIRKAIELDATHGKYYLLLSELYFTQNDMTRSISALEDGLEQEPANEKILLVLTQYHIYLQELEKAIGYADEVLRINVNNAEAYFYKGIIFKEIGDTAKAISRFQTAVEQNPLLYDAYMQLGILLSIQDNEDALLYFDNAIRVDTASAEAYYGKGVFLQNRGDIKGAMDIYKKIVTIDPDFSKAFYNMGYLYYQMDSLEKADNNFTIAVNVEPTYADGYYMKGLIAEERGNTELAVKFYRQALALANGQHELAINRLEALNSL